MKKLKNNAGFSLIELLCALLILVILVMAIGVGMDTGTKLYFDATFEAESATLAGILNTSIGDILRFSSVTKTEDITNVPEGFDRAEVPYVFTSVDYGIQHAYFYTPVYEDGTSKGVLQMKNLKNDKVVELVNTGAYPDLVIYDFEFPFEPRKNPGIEGGYFTVSYKIASKSDPTKIREVEMIVRLMND